MKLTSFSLLLSLVFVGAQYCSPGIAASANSNLAEAEQAYASRRFHAAEDLLNAAIAKNPTDQEAHLMLARTYVQLLDNKAAEHEYSNCIKCNPFSSIGRMAHQETISIGGHMAANKARPSDDVGTVSKSVDNINREANDLKSGYGTASNTMTPNYSQPNPYNPYGQPGMAGASGQPGMPGAYGQPGSPGAYPQSLTLGASSQSGATISAAQARLAAQRAQLAAQRATRLSTLNTITAAPYSISPNSALNSALGSSAMAPVPAQYMPPSSPSAPPNFTQTYTPSSNLRTSQNRAFNAAQAGNSTTPTGTWSYTTSDAQVQQMHKQQEDAQHAQYAQDSANNLQRLMSERQNANSPKLRALGTNLFVRYYGSHDQDGSTADAPKADPVVEMKAKQWKLGDLK